MRNITLSFCLLVFILSWGYSQQSIDGTINFESDPAKKYSLYIPSAYNEGTPIPMMLGLHPLNTQRWDAESWRDTLIVFSERNSLLLVCPDGGPDGRIDDPIDTAFATFLMDSVIRAYSIDENHIYAMGFSWGGRTTYTYGLSHIERFAGLMPIGAAINGLNEVGPWVDEGRDHNVFIIHGRNDSPNSRFFPVRDALEEAEACVFDTLMTGVGHTIDFPGRNDLLTMGYEYLRENSCGVTTKTDERISIDWKPKNPWEVGYALEIPEHITITSIWDVRGQQYDAEDPIVFQKEGVYIVHYKTKWGRVGFAKLMVRK